MMYGHYLRNICTVINQSEARKRKEMKVKSLYESMNGELVNILFTSDFHHILVIIKWLTSYRLAYSFMQQNLSESDC